MSWWVGHVSFDNRQCNMDTTFDPDNVKPFFVDIYPRLEPLILVSAAKKVTSPLMCLGQVWLVSAPLHENFDGFELADECRITHLGPGLLPEPGANPAFADPPLSFHHNGYQLLFIREVIHNAVSHVNAW